jgi:hypothetical protein
MLETNYRLKPINVSAIKWMQLGDHSNDTNSNGKFLIDAPGQSPKEITCGDWVVTLPDSSILIYSSDDFEKYFEPTTLQHKLVYEIFDDAESATKYLADGDGDFVLIGTNGFVVCDLHTAKSFLMLARNYSAEQALGYLDSLVSIYQANETLLSSTKSK